MKTSVSLSFSDFTDLPQNYEMLPISMRITVTVWGGPAYFDFAQWDGIKDNSYFRMFNQLLSARQRVSKLIRWPSTPTLIQGAKSNQSLVVMAQPDSGTVYSTSTPPVLFYMASLWCCSIPDGLNLAADPAHYNVKHGSSPFHMIEDM